MFVHVVLYLILKKLCVLTDTNVEAALVKNCPSFGGPPQPVPGKVAVCRPKEGNESVEGLHVELTDGQLRARSSLAVLSV